MEENQTINEAISKDISKLEEIVVGSVIGVGKLTYGFLRGALTLPRYLLTMPTQIRICVNGYKESKEKGLDIISKKDVADYFTNDTARAIGVLTTAALIGVNTNEISNYIGEHPYILIIPLITNILNLGYEKYRSDEIKEMVADTHKRSD